MKFLKKNPKNNAEEVFQAVFLNKIIKMDYRKNFKKKEEFPNEWSRNFKESFRIYFQRNSKKTPRSSQIIYPQRKAVVIFKSIA